MCLTSTSKLPASRADAIRISAQIPFLELLSRECDALRDDLRQDSDDLALGKLVPQRLDEEVADHPLALGRPAGRCRA
jgi:hypothetical protein